MADLNDPLKAVFIAVYDMVGNQLASSVEEGDLSVVSVRYKYDDEDDDTCTIKFQMSNPKSLDILKIVRGTKLQVIWGYLNNPVSPTTTVVVRDMTSKYGSNIIYTELECTDYLTYLKVARSPDVAEGSVVEFIKAQVYGRYNIVIKDRGNRVYSQSKRIEGEEYDELIQVTAPENWPRFAGNVMFDPLDDNPSDDIETFLVKDDPGIGRWYVGEAHPLREYLEKNNKIPTSNRSIFVVLQDLMKTCPNGPWFVTGRGGTLLIHNRDLGRTIYKAYKYMDEPGSLIDFTPKTKFENFDKQMISYAGMDPKDRRNFFIDDYRIALTTQRNPKEILEDKKITPEEKAIELKEYTQLRLRGYATFGHEAREGAFFDPGGPSQLFLPGKFDEPYIKKPGFIGPAVADHSRVENPDPMVRKEEGGFDPEIHDQILRAIWYTFPLLTFNEAVNQTNNRQRQLAMDKEEAKIILEGDPWIMSEHTIRITNVHSQHEGHYYIKKCEHIVTNQGYKTQLDCLKVVPEAKIKTLSNITKDEYLIEDESLEEIFNDQLMREKALFGDDVVITYFVPQDRIQPYGGQSATFYEKYKKNEVRLGDIFVEGSKYTDDQFIKDAISALSRTGVSISFDPENK